MNQTSKEKGQRGTQEEPKEHDSQSESHRTRWLGPPFLLQRHDSYTNI